MQHHKDCDCLHSAHPCNCGLTRSVGPSQRTEEADLIRASASEGACYAYPGEDQAALRQAFCDGAVYTRTGKLPE